MIHTKLLFFGLLLAAGQILFKKAAQAGDTFLGTTNWPLNAWFLAALTIYGITTLIWVDALRTIPLSIAYPYSALGFVLVPLAARAFFSEPLSLVYWVGSFLIISGILTIAFSEG